MGTKRTLNEQVMNILVYIGDAEHPKVIPMVLSSSHQVPSGPMTRARARALETEVTSLVFELPPPIHETWFYLKRRHFSYSGTLERLRSKVDRKEKTDEKTDKKKSYRRSSSHRSSGTWRPTCPSPSLRMLQRADSRPPPDDRRLCSRTESAEVRSLRTTDASAPELN